MNILKSVLSFIQKIPVFSKTRAQSTTVVNMHLELSPNTGVRTGDSWNEFARMVSDTQTPIRWSSSNEHGWTTPHHTTRVSTDAMVAAKVQRMAEQVWEQHISRVEESDDGYVLFLERRGEWTAKAWDYRDGDTTEYGPDSFEKVREMARGWLAEYDS